MPKTENKLMTIFNDWITNEKKTFAGWKPPYPYFKVNDILEVTGGSWIRFKTFHDFNCDKFKEKSDKMRDSKTSELSDNSYFPSTELETLWLQAAQIDWSR